MTGQDCGNGIVPQGTAGFNHSLAFTREFQPSGHLPDQNINIGDGTQTPANKIPRSLGKIAAMQANSHPAIVTWVSGSDNSGF
jgi:hypothetical protein